MVAKPLQSGATLPSRHSGHGASPAPLRRIAQTQSGGDPAVSAAGADLAVVLRMLIEEFGGEVTSSALAQRLVQLSRWRQARSDLWVRVVLGELEHRGAITLEDVNETDVVARIQLAGVALAYDANASSNASTLRAAS